MIPPRLRAALSYLRDTMNGDPALLDELVRNARLFADAGRCSELAADLLIRDSRGHYDVGPSLDETVAESAARTNILGAGLQAELDRRTRELVLELGGHPRARAYTAHERARMDDPALGPFDPREPDAELLRAGESVVCSDTTASRSEPPAWSEAPPR